MTKYSKESLEKLLDLIDEICKDEENLWFKEKLGKNNISDFPSYFKLLKKQYKIKGENFYKKIEKGKLRNQLISDFSEMMWFQNINNINRFLLFLFYQYENMINFYCIKSNAYDKIESNKNYFIHQFNPTFTVICVDSFFKNEIRNPIEKVNIWAKTIFWILDSKNIDWEKNNHNNISNLIQTRNQNSHRNTFSNGMENLTAIEMLVKSDFSSLSFYINILKKLIETINTINPNEKINDNKTLSELPKLKGLKILGTIDTFNNL